MRPHAKDVPNAVVAIDSVNDAVLNIDAPRVIPSEVAHQLLEARRHAQRIVLQQKEQFLSR